jgi:uncharacterized protein (DUF1697 family)
MCTQIALLRAVNVAGHNKVAISDLRALLDDLGFADAKSLLQSGNLVFQSNLVSGAALEQLLEKESAKRLGLTTEYFVRSADEWKQIVAHNPFPKEAKTAPGHLVVVFLKAAPTAKNVDALRAAIRGPETITADGKQLYVVYPAGIGRSKLTLALIEQKLAFQATARNWNTVVKLAALCE